MWYLSNALWDLSIRFLHATRFSQFILTILYALQERFYPFGVVEELPSTELNYLTGQGWGLLSRFPPFRYFPNFSALSKHTLDIEYHVYIWQVSPQLSCGDTCQIWKWFKESNRYFWKIENFANGEINERSFSNPHPRTISFRLAQFNVYI